VERHPDGRTFCSVMRGRQRVELTSEVAARLAGWSTARSGGPAAGGRGPSR